jgi:Na+/melibiose symporter-like transporter
MDRLGRLKPWLLLILVASAVAFILLAAQADDRDPWIFGVAVFYGVMAAIVVWREKETPASAWQRLKQPPREGL